MTDDQPTAQAVEPTIEALSRFIVEKTNSHWEQFKQPYFLANIPQDLKKFDVDYKKIIFPDSLKHFVTKALAEHVNVITHPIQKAKVVLVPKDVYFRFEYENPIAPAMAPFDFLRVQDAPKPDFPAGDRMERRETLVRFLTLLRDFPEHEVENVKIPTSVLIKLLV